jgi:hypothetical protein
MLSLVYTTPVRHPKMLAIHVATRTVPIQHLQNTTKEQLHHKVLMTSNMASNSNLIPGLFCFLRKESGLRDPSVSTSELGDMKISVFCLLFKIRNAGLRQELSFYHNYFSRSHLQNLEVEYIHTHINTHADKRELNSVAVVHKRTISTTACRGS